MRSVESVCVYVCLSVCNLLTFQSLDIVKFRLQVQLQQFNFVYQSREVKIMITGA